MRYLENSEAFMKAEGWGLRGRWSGWAITAVGLAVLAGCVHEPPPTAKPPPVAVVQPVIQPAAPAPVHVPRPPRIGLALGGGAARGFAHIGVLQVLGEQGIHPDMVVGTSAGSLVATLYAAGKSPEQLASLAQAMDESTLTDWTFPGRAVLRGEALAHYVRSNTGGLRIEQMKLPLGIVATDLDSGQAILFQRGDPGVAVRASSAVPAVFEPVRMGGHEYVDGGLTAPVPVHFARDMGAELIIAVDISASTEGNPTGTATQMLLQTFAIMGHTINHYELQGADVVVRPKLDGVSGADFGSRRLAILAGREAMLSQLAALRARIAALTR